MSRTLKVAAIQMDATPAPTAERLARAGGLVTRAAGAGAQLVVLTEVFNTGYQYTDDNYLRAEPADGPTMAWMKQTAHSNAIHLAGTFLLREGEDIFNAMFLIAPDGRTWRYDKRYPAMWERAYFRAGRGLTMPDTDLGRFGLMICWDGVHTDLWAGYAGQVDMIVICSCPPAFQQARTSLPDGTTENTGRILIPSHFRPAFDAIFGGLFRRQAAYLQVPLVNTTPAGQFSSPLPLPRLSTFGSGIFAPRLWRHLKDARALHQECPFYQDTYIADQDGQMLAQVPSGEEGFALAEVTLADRPPNPIGRQPKFGLPVVLYGVDWLLNLLLVPTYRRKVRQSHHP
ncbi:MAG: carbon-nitrogen hydrolase family protein [Anaerolineales bacterium]|nr:carbon-nitrogen hydrolase family protein [Anaerolineales bacterium]